MIAAPPQHEQIRNKVLRRADWRFLLPDPRPATSICFAEGLLAEAVGAISHHVVPGGASTAHDCDLAVAVNPDAETIRAAWAALRGGGACYTEWYGPSAGGPNGIRRRLRAAGFDEVTCYWPSCRPSRMPPLFWLPVEAPGALRYFLATRPRSRALAPRAGQVLRQALWRLALPAGLALPICAVARKPRTVADDALRSGPGLLDVVRSERQALGPGSAPTRLSLLLVTRGARSINKVVALVFAEPDARPRLVVKVPRVPESSAGLAREAAVLSAVHGLRPGGMPGMPRTLFFRTEHGGVLGETPLEGTPVFSQLRRENYARLARQATAWLIELARTSAARPGAGWWHAYAEALLAAFVRCFGPVVDAGMIEETRALLHELGDLPAVCEQRDFSPWNVLVGPDGSLAVLDWESAELRGLPGLDLVYFLAHLALFQDGALRSGRIRESYRAVLDPSTFTGQVFAECLMQYANELHLDPATLRPLRLLTWLLHAQSEYERLVADCGEQPGRDALKGSLFLQLWEEDLRGARSVSPL